MSKPIVVEVELKVVDSKELEKSIASQIKNAVTKSTAEIIKLLEGHTSENTKRDDRVPSDSDNRQSP